MSVVFRFTDGTSFELINGQTTYGVTGLFMGSGLYPFDKYDYDGNHWYINSNGSYSLPRMTEGSSNFTTGTFPDSHYGCFFSYIRSDGYFYYSQANRPAYTSTIPTSGRYVYTGGVKFAMPYYAESVRIWGGIQLSESLIKRYFPISTATPVITYPITYHYENSTVSGPSEAAVGDTVTVSAVPDVGYGITDASTQILVTNNDVAVPYTWDATNQRITFTMPEGAVTVTVTASLIPTYPITYRPTRVTLDGPATAAVGATVNVDCAFPEGYGVKTTDSITVTCNRVPVPFSWDSENQRITFTMPDPTA